MDKPPINWCRISEPSTVCIHKKGLFQLDEPNLYNKNCCFAVSPNIHQKIGCCIRSHAVDGSESLVVYPTIYMFFLHPRWLFGISEPSTVSIHNRPSVLNGKFRYDIIQSAIFPSFGAQIKRPDVRCMWKWRAFFRNTTNRFFGMILLMEEILHHLGYINLVNNGINYISTGAGFLPSTVLQRYCTILERYYGHTSTMI